MLLIRVAYHNAAFGNGQISFKKVWFPLKKALAAFVENKVIGARIVAVVWQHKINHLTVHDSFQDFVFLIFKIWAFRLFRKAF